MESVWHSQNVVFLSISPVGMVSAGCIQSFVEAAINFIEMEMLVSLLDSSCGREQESGAPSASFGV